MLTASEIYILIVFLKMGSKVYNRTIHYKRSCVAMCSVCSAAIDLHGNGAHSNLHPASARRPSLSQCSPLALNEITSRDVHF